MPKLSPHFALEEFTSSGTATRLGISNTPSAAVLKNLTRLAAELEKVRTLMGYSLRILSGYRSPALNKAVGGAAKSFHLDGCAADFDPPPGMTHNELQHAIGSDPNIDFDLVLEEKARSGAHWLHFQIPRPGTKGRRKLLDAELKSVGSPIGRITIG